MALRNLLWFYPINKLIIKKIKGEENIPNKAPFLITSNHESRCDHWLIIYPILKKLGKKVHFVAIPRWWYNFFQFLRYGFAEIIPMVNPKKAYKDAKQAIESGAIVAIFPEGRLERTNRTKNPKTGAIRLAVETKVPILPIGIKFFYRPFSCTINIGKPIYIKKKSNIKKQTFKLMKYIYMLRDN